MPAATDAATASVSRAGAAGQVQLSLTSTAPGSPASGASITAASELQVPPSAACPAGATAGGNGAAGGAGYLCISAPEFEEVRDVDGVIAVSSVD
jgi:hypothetical protein